MNFIEHLENIQFFQQTSGSFTWSVFSFYGTSYSPVFFDLYTQYLRQHDIPLKVLDVYNLDMQEISSILAMSFLGQNSVYWCGDLTALDSNKKKQLYVLLKTYTGPHSVITFTDQVVLKDFSVELPQQIESVVLKKLYSLLFPEKLSNETIIKLLYVRNNTIYLDHACRVLSYLDLLDGLDPDVASEWLSRLMHTEQSLFMVSQYFFAKDRKTFASLWLEVNHDFPLEFWIAFWSEQLWQASLFVQQAAALGPLAGRKGVTRLPFSFMQRDWRQYTARELCAAHNFLYSVDYGSKNGYATYGLDLFIDHWMLATFAKK